MEIAPEIDITPYKVGNDTWGTLQSEIIRITDLIDSETELQPSDVKEVQSLAKQVRAYGVEYSKAITSEAKNYKAKLDQELDRLGYTKIENYVAEKSRKQKADISARLNAKLTRFKQIVNDEMQETEHLRVSPIASYMINSLSSRFPKLNTGAASKEITKWEPIEAVVKTTVQKLESIFVANPIIMSLPAQSKTLRALSNYVATGDESLVEDIHSLLVQDQAIIQRMALKPRVATDDLAVDEIDSIIKSDISNDVKLKRIALILEVRNSQA